MQVYDIIMLVVLLAAAFLGYRKGLVWQIASLSAIFVSYFVAVNFRDVVAQKIDAEAPWNTFLAMLVLYVGTSFAIWIVFQLIRGAIDQAKLKDFDRQLGALLGLVKGAVLCLVITFFAVTLLGEGQQRQIVESKSGYYIAKFLDQADAIMPTELSKVLGPYLERLDQGLEGAGPSLPNTDLFPELDPNQDYPWTTSRPEATEPPANSNSQPDAFDWGVEYRSAGDDPFYTGTNPERR